MTRRRITKTRGRPRLSCRCARIAPFALAALAALPGRAAPEPRPIDARVVWARADRVYIAADDSLALAPGDLLELKRGKNTVALGSVLQVLARNLAAARLTAGSLERVSRLDRVRVLAERPPLAALPLLRIGCPGRGRTGLLFECARPVPRPPLAGDAYRADSLGASTYRFVLAPGVAGAPWPDTIIVRLFGDIADQEIALERGEVDIAIFWPGEASARLRGDPRWAGFSYGSRGALAASLPAGGAGAGLSPDLPPLAALNDQIFRGDLAPRRATAPGSAPPADRLRFVVDPSCPGRATLERFLDRATASADSRNDPVRLFYIESQAPAPDSLGVAILFTVRCPLVCAPGLRAYVAALGADSIVRILECAPAGRAP